MSAGTCSKCGETVEARGLATHEMTCDPELNARMRADHESGLSVRGVAKLHEVSVMTASRGIKRAGGEIRIRPKRGKSLNEVDLPDEPTYARDLWAHSGRCPECKQPGTYGVEHECVKVRVTKLAS